MTCAKIVALMGVYISGDASEKESMAVREHTLYCTKCRHELEQKIASCSGADDSVPELSDEESGRNKWHANNAAGNQAKTRCAALRKLLPIVVALLFLAVGSVAGRWLGVQRNRAAEASQGPALLIKAEKNVSAQHSASKSEGTSETAVSPDKSASAEDSKTNTNMSTNPEDYVEAYVNMARDVGTSGLVATRFNRTNKQRRVIILDSSTPLDAERENKELEEKPNEIKLPNPTTLNNAETIEQHSLD